MRDSIEMVPKVPSVTKKFLIVILSLFVIAGCSVVKNTTKEQSKLYNIEKYVSKNERTCYLILNCFEEENKEEKINAGFFANGISFREIKPLIVQPGNYSLKTFFIGRKSVDIIGLNVVRGDSIVINVPMKVFLPPSH